MQVQFTLTRENAVMPRYATAGAAAADLCCALEAPVTIEAGGRMLIPTGVAIALPGAEYVALICARSGLAVKKGLTLSNGIGVIDSDYRGELQVGLVNLGVEAYTIEPGERIAQLMIMPVVQAEFLKVNTLDETERGESGFGSTGRM